LVKDTDLYQLIGLSKPRQVREVKLELDKQRVTVRIECDDGVVWGELSTGERAYVHGWSKRQLRHLDILPVRDGGGGGGPQHEACRWAGGRSRRALGRELQSAEEADGGLRHPGAPGSQQRAGDGQPAGHGLRAGQPHHEACRGKRTAFGIATLASLRSPQRRPSQG